eukprot:4502910-Amphidinium_carterae.2
MTTCKKKLKLSRFVLRRYEALPSGATRTAHARDSSANGFNRSRVASNPLENASERWGPFLISKIRRAGAVIGLGASCLSHHNVGDKASNCYQKALDYGRRNPLTEVQAKLCLKRCLLWARHPSGPSCAH